MNFVSRTVTGIIMIIVGLVLVVVSPFSKYLTLIYGIPLLVLGIFVFLNRKEDKIEQIKKLKRGERK